MNQSSEAPISRKQIAIRFLYTLLYLLLYGFAKCILVATTLFQFIYLFITLQHSEPVRTFANRVVAYVYQVWRYVTLNSSQRLFPFAEFPQEMEPPAEGVIFPG